jgi:hypothetical protein
MSDIKIFNLAAYEQPEIKEDTRNEWVEYGEANDYYNFLIDRSRKSTTNSAVINNISRLIYGRGLHAIDAARKPSQYAAMRSIFSAECLRKVIKELKMLGAGHFQVHYDEKHTKVIKAYHIPTNLIRPEKCNADGDIEAYYYSDNWEDTRKFAPKRIPAFGTSKEKIEILCIKDYAVGVKYFGEIDYLAAVPYAILEEEISNYLINEVQNGFSGTKVVNFNNGVPDQEKQEEVSRKVLNKLTGSRGQKVIVAFNSNAESKTTVDDIPLNDAPQHYEYLSKEAEQKILTGHTVTSPMLVGIVTDNQGFSSNADEIEVAARYFYNATIKPFQELMTDAIDKILAFNGISLDLYFRRLNLLEEIEIKEQEEEQESEMNFSSQLDDLLAEFGEDEDEEWELIDSREVDYDKEDELDAQVMEWEQSMQPKKSLLSKIYNLVSTGTARGNASSKQDKEVDGFFFKVRYKYTGNKNPERDFCKAMMAKQNRIFRKEDIEMMSRSIVNAGFGEFGADTYDIFKFKGGARCHHKWERRTYVSATRSIDVNSPNATTVGTRVAEVKGYTVRNPFEVSIYPNNLPLKGFSPNNKNLPSDVR